MKHYMLFILLFSMSTLLRAQVGTPRYVASIDSAIRNDRVYLIITNQKFNSAVASFAQWKRTKGLTVYVLSAANNYVWTDQSVLTAINDCELSGNTVDYILFVGDQNNVPGHACFYQIDSANLNFYSDYFYECKGNTANSPSVRVGRIPVSTNAEAEAVFDKIIAYEKEPTDCASFYQTAACTSLLDFRSEASIYPPTNVRPEAHRIICSSENIHAYLEDSIVHPLDIKRIYFHNSPFYDFPDSLGYNNDRYAQGELFPDELLDPNVWLSDSCTINDSINAGNLFMTYLGDGTSKKWTNDLHGEIYGDSTLYEVINTNSLSNYQKYPVIWSLANQTGLYDETTNCPAEFFLKKNDAGAVAVIAPTDMAFDGYREYLAEGFVNAVWPTPGINQQHPLNTPVYELGDILAVSREWMGYMKFFDTNTLYMSDTYRYGHQKDSYHLFGDPSMMMYTALPSHYSNVIIRKNGNLLIVDTHEPNTRITFYTPAAPDEDYVDSYIGEHVEYHNEILGDSMLICIDKHNFVPYIQAWHYNLYIQNETILDTRSYIGENINIGHHVTSNKPQGNVLIQGANLDIQGGNVTLCAGTTIVNSNVTINRRE